MPLITSDLEFSDDYPTIEPSLRLDFANTRALDSRISFTRASVGTYVGANGLIKTAGEDEPRFDHDPTTGESLGLLIEESRTNILKGTSAASNFTNSGGYWTIGGNRASQGSDQIAPDGTSSAFNIVYNGTSGDANIYYSDAGNNGGGEAPTSNSTVYTLSVFAKIPSGNSYIEGIRIRTYNTNHSCQFNLSTGTIVGTSEGATTNRMEAYPNGWYRCSITFTSGTDGNQGVQLYLFNSTSNTALNNSSANGEALYLWGAQLEEGAFPTSYISTSGSTVTRAVDLPYIEGTSFSSWYNSEGGAYVLDVMVYSYSGSFFGFGTSSYLESFNVSNSGGNQFYVSGNYNTSNAYTGNMNLDQSNKIGASFDSTGQRVCSNGLSVNASSFSSGSTSLFTDFDRLSFGGNIPWDKNYTSQRKTHVKSFSYYTKYISDAQLQTLTQ